jgi:hypothetical protein
LAAQGNKQMPRTVQEKHLKFFPCGNQMAFQFVNLDYFAAKQSCGRFWTAASTVGFPANLPEQRQLA